MLNRQALFHWIENLDIGWLGRMSTSLLDGNRAPSDKQVQWLVCKVRPRLPVLCRGSRSLKFLQVYRATILLFQREERRRQERGKQENENTLKVKKSLFIFFR